MLKNKRVLIIGGTSGIGLATAKMAVNKGAEVIIAGRSQLKLEQAITEIGSNSSGYVIDILNENDLAEFFGRFNYIDHVFVTAAEVVLGSIHETNASNFRNTLDSRVWGAFNTAKYASKKMRAGGSFTFMSGSSTWKPAVGGAIAAAAGGAVEALGRALAIELSPIRVNTIAAGVVQTPLLDSFYGDEKVEALENLAQTLPVKRVGTADNIANTALYLMNNTYSTGTVIAVDGGILLT